LTSIYKGDDKIKEAKLQAFREKFEWLKMNEEEKIVDYLLRVHEIVNAIYGLGDSTLDELVVVKKVLRSLIAKYDSKISVVEEIDLRKLTLDEIHGTFTTYEMKIYHDESTSKDMNMTYHR